MPRFEFHIPPVPDREGVNPFTKKPIVIRGRPGRSRFWEVERRGSTISQCWDEPGGPVAKKEQVFESEDRAREVYRGLVAKRQKMGFVETGPSRELEPSADGEPAGSWLLIDEFFASGDERFVDELVRAFGPTKLAALAERWYGDARPFARKTLLAYVDDGCDRPEHKALVKRLFKLAEKSGDDEAMGHFMVAFDRLLGRTLGVRGMRWNPVLRKAEEIPGLLNNRSVPERLMKDAKGKQRVSARFSRATRRYLARRAFRYFREIGRRDPARYGAAMRACLPLYRDETLDTPAKLLDAWGLMHALYGYSPVLVKAPSGLVVHEDRSLSELQPAPYFAPAWEGVFDGLVAMLVGAQSRTVRTWTIKVLREKYDRELSALPLARIRQLLASPHEEVLALGAELLKGATGLDAMSIADWLDLLRIEHVDVLGLICETIKNHVTPARLDLAQCIELACAKAAPVALLGLEWARGKRVASREDLESVLRLAKAGAVPARRDGARWIASLLQTLPFATTEQVRDFCDAQFADARAEALACLATERYKDDLTLWFALTESPYDDVRAFVLRHAGAWKEKAAPATLTHVWASALLAIHRGGATKRRVPGEIAERIASHPDEAPKLLPILGVALRSVRPTERTVALASLTRAVLRNDALRGLVHEHLPEISFSHRVTA
jgi:hypothetical protein